MRGVIGGRNVRVVVVIRDHTPFSCAVAIKL